MNSEVNKMQSLVSVLSMKLCELLCIRTSKKYRIICTFSQMSFIWHFRSFAFHQNVDKWTVDQSWNCWHIQFPSNDFFPNQIVDSLDQGEAVDIHFHFHICQCFYASPERVWSRWHKVTFLRSTLICASSYETYEEAQISVELRTDVRSWSITTK